MVRIRSRLAASAALLTIAVALSTPAAAGPPVEPMPRACVPVACAAWFAGTTTSALAAEVDAAAAASGRSAVELLLDRVDTAALTLVAEVAAGSGVPADIMAVHAVLQARDDVVAVIRLSRSAGHPPLVAW